MMPVRGGRITSGFSEPRPLSKPGAHIHGALDIAGGEGIIRAPCAGSAQGFAIFRRPGFVWGKDEKKAILYLPFRERFEDIYGAFIALTEAETGRLHLFCHLWPDALFGAARKAGFEYGGYLETATVEAYPAHILLTKEKEVEEGEALCPVGNAGCSKGSHLHWEVHHHCHWLDGYAERVDPTEYL